MATKKRYWHKREHRPNPQDSIFYGAVAKMLGQRLRYFKNLYSYIESKEKHDEGM